MTLTWFQGHSGIENVKLKDVFLLCLLCDQVQALHLQVDQFAYYYYWLNETNSPLYDFKGILDATRLCVDTPVIKW